MNASVQFGARNREDLISLASFKEIHLGESFLVCGCGESLNDLKEPPGAITIGVNDVGRRFQPDYLVVVNPRSQFTSERFHYIETSRARYLFTQYGNLRVPHTKVIKFQLGHYGGTDFTDPDVLHFTQNSPYVAMCLAVHMGAKRIGLLGVDLTDNHFFAKTGKHALAARLEQIDREYANLAQACRSRGIEVHNLSIRSRLRAFPKADIAELTASEPVMPGREKRETPERRRKIFVVNYRFLSCGEVFTHGLHHAARDLEIVFEEAYWDEPNLHGKVDAFRPDLLFVVHGRRFAQRWRNAFPGVKKAVWLLDEPYEVDDTAQWSRCFDVVFVNDPSTLCRHANAHYLPVAYDPAVHREGCAIRSYAVGFIGGYNQTRECHLLSLAKEGLLSYVVGGPWKSPVLRRLRLADNIPAKATAELYQQTQVIVNTFRDIHHFNRHQIPAHSLNPRVYEALACGALVVSERRREVEAVFPELPVYETGDELVATVRRLVEDGEARKRLLVACHRRLGEHTYRHRLQTALAISLGTPTYPNERGKAMEAIEARVDTEPPAAVESVRELPAHWVDCGHVVLMAENGEVVLAKPRDDTPGSEEGLASEAAFGTVELAFEIELSGDAIFLAKIHQSDRFDQTTNSYHFCYRSGRAYLAMHHRILSEVPFTRKDWASMVFGWRDGVLTLACDGVQLATVREQALPTGYCFLGVKGGQARVRNLRLTVPDSECESQSRPELTGWEARGSQPQFGRDGIIVSSASADGWIGSETGFASEAALTQVELSFDLKLDSDSTFIAKIHHQDRNDPATNSYHLICSPDRDYLAKHYMIFSQLRIPRDSWQSITLRRTEHARIELILNDVSVATILDIQLQSGCCFLGVGYGRAELRNIRLRDLAELVPDQTLTQPSLTALPAAKQLSSASKPDPLPFSDMPLRNLIYHVWPVNGSMWQWNLEQLKERIDIFNGRRIVGIVYDARSAPPETVMDTLAGHGCEFFVRPNDTRGESITFPHLIREVASLDANEITFYGHAKGVKYEPNVPQPVRRWAETQYRTALDNWLEVRRQVEHYALTGPFRMLGRFRTHHNLGDWHYSGTYFWMRHAFVFIRNCLQIPQFYGAVEAWPGIHFGQTETGCLFLDQLRQLPYLTEFWTSLANPALQHWEAKRQVISPPPDLVKPSPFDGHAWPRVEQKPEELEWWIRTLLECGARRLLTIGAMHGGVEWHLARIFRDNGQDLDITTVDLSPGPEAYHAFQDAAQRFGQGMRLIAHDSSSESLKAQLDEHYDAVFIDGDHGYRGVRSDWQLAQALKPRLVGFHDIVDSDWHIQCRCCVSRLWAELKAEHETDERTSEVWGGIGIVRL